MPFQRRASPFPHTSHVALPTQFVAFLSHWHRMKVIEAYIAAFKVGKEQMRVQATLGARGAILRRLGWW